MSYGSRGRVSRRNQKPNRTLRRIEEQTAGLGAYGLIGNRVYTDMEVFAKEAGFFYRRETSFSGMPFATLSHGESNAEAS